MTKQEQLAHWNANYPPGTPIKFRATGSAKWKPSRTRSQAWALGDGSPVVLIEGKTGGFSLDFVRAVDAKEQA